MSRFGIDPSVTSLAVLCLFIQHLLMAPPSGDLIKCVQVDCQMDAISWLCLGDCRVGSVLPCAYIYMVTQLLLRLVSQQISWVRWNCTAPFSAAQSHEHKVIPIGIQCGFEEPAALDQWCTL